MSEFKQYRRKSVSEMRPYVEGDTLDGKVSISEADLKGGSPLKGDMIARNPKNHEDQWLVAKTYFEDNLEAID
jgi:ribosomal protein L19